MLFDTVTLIGVGLIGGSIGRAIRAKKVARHVIGVGRDAAMLQLAVDLGAIDAFSTDAEAARESDFFVVCTPVDTIARLVAQTSQFAKPGAIITDAGSTKANVLRAVRGLVKPGIAYAGSHPLAGSEQSGIEHSRANLFEGKTTVVVPDDVPEAAVEKVEAFWHALGSKTLRMSAEEHDRAAAFASHLPHAVAAATARILPPQWRALAASGFRDTTRIAAGEPALWEAILTANRDAVINAIMKFRESLEVFERLLQNRDSAGLYHWLDEGKQVRDALGS